MTLQDVLKFVRTNQHAVISTISEGGKPHTAVVDFCEQDDLTIIINTPTTSGLYKNLQHSPHVAIVIGGKKGVVVQISAVAHELSGAELEAARGSLCIKNDRARNRNQKSGIVYFAFEPTWIRYADLNPDPWYIEEFST